MSSNRSLMSQLNPEQKAAVTSGARFLRVLAGAGSGKTRVLVHRAAFLIQELGVSPYDVLAVTFTNKAAAEMRHRIESLCGRSTQGMWIGTFHGLSHRLLRIHYKDAGLDQQFQIIDADDQRRVVTRIYKELKIKEEDITPKQAVSFINREKDEGRYPCQAYSADQYVVDRHVMLLQQVYERYQAICTQSNLVDFAELLLRSLTLLDNNPSIQQLYQTKFEYILVDEFQDTNMIQFRWLQALLHASNAITIVGDDDQSIYGWRGAQIENILRFSEYYPETETVRLEQNYRSTKCILGAANGVIACNIDRLGKALWTQKEEGDTVQLYSAYNEIDEAQFIVDRICAFQSKGFHHKQQAVLYRSNAQSRVLEEAFLRARIPYRIYGGQRFFDRAEIKSALAYLRLVMLPDDDAAFERVVNFPARGLGERSVQCIRDQARAQSISLWQASHQLIEHNGMATRALNALKHFIGLIQSLQSDLKKGTLLSEFVSLTLQRTQLSHAYARESIEQRQAREDNLKELISAAVSFNQMSDVGVDDEFLPTRSTNNVVAGDVFGENGVSILLGALAMFLDHVSLESGEVQASAHSDAVQIMTIHASKGLEFPVVFLAGLEEGLFPSQMSMNEPGRIEEERRLCYVGMTRAAQFLTLSYAESRRVYGEERRTRVSRFVREIPSECMNEVRMGSVVLPVVRSRLSESISTRVSVGSDQSADVSEVKVGAKVMHRAFGEGVVLATEGRGVRMRVQVNFARAGSKWLMAKVAKLELI